MSTDVVVGRYGPWVVAEASVGPILLNLNEDDVLIRGDVVRVLGDLSGDPGSAGGRPYRAVVEVSRLELVSSNPSPAVFLGGAVRNHVTEHLAPYNDGRGLLAGFLIGDTTNVSERDIEAMRLSGLSHFVAVSGSNVALFLGLLVLVAGPLALGPRRRAIVGLLGLPVYAAATRFEPSVMRASVMAGIALTGRLLGVVFEAWQLLATAVVVLVISEPALVWNAGFQLSVVATAGVLVGSRWPVKGGRAARTLAITIGAQVAVAPILLIQFGSVPLLSPVANLVAAPLVAMATLIGAIGVGAVPFLIDPAAALAELVLSLARGAAGWPQLEVGEFGLVAVTAGIAIARPRIRPVVFMVATGVLVAVLFIPGELPDPGVIVLDVGQGDAILIHGGDGRFALVDGGPDPEILRERLRHYGVESLELIVLSHVHADHATGLIELVGNLPVGEVWASVDPHETEASARFFQAVTLAGVALTQPAVGEVRQIGKLRLRVEGPLRRYASPNDQSLVLSVNGRSRSMLLTGDIETFAQADLDYLRADVLKVPHQGGATSDAEWLRRIGAGLAVISVGPNQFGHPAEWVIEVLEEAGAEIARTDEVGDVLVHLP